MKSSTNRLEISDDRTAEQHATHSRLVFGKDPGMSGWGGAEGRSSYAGWACRPSDEARVLAWVKARGDIRNVEAIGNIGASLPQLIRGRAHVHIYAVTDGHPSLAAQS